MYSHGVTEYREEDFLMLSGIQHFAFCRRQWALIHIEGVWEENARTAEGRLLHENAHDASRLESRGKTVISRAVPVFSRELGLSGECDVVEYHLDPDGVPLAGRDGRWTVFPVEYKRGSPKEDPCDMLQLTAQAMALEEMLCCTIFEGALYYFEIKHRQSVPITEELRKTVREYAEEMHRYAERFYLPKPKRTKACGMCSLKDECLPSLSRLPSASAWNEENLGGKTE